MQQVREIDVTQYRIPQEPFYAEVCGEIGLFTIAAERKLPVMLKGPTGCGKTRFVQYMAYTLGRPLITVACHEDLTASDLVGRYLLKGQETVWMDGPLTVGVKHGAIVYLDEVVEARKDTTVPGYGCSGDRYRTPGQVLPSQRFHPQRRRHQRYLQGRRSDGRSAQLPFSGLEPVRRIDL